MTLRIVKKSPLLFLFAISVLLLRIIIHNVNLNYETIYYRDFNPNITRTFKTQSSDDCLQFDHGNISHHHLPNVTSVFNCNSSSGKCKWFYPAKFFDVSCGIGKKHSSVLEYMERQRINKSLWVNSPPIILQRVSLHPGIKPNGKPPARTTSLPTHNLTMLRVHKAGSSSLVKAFQSLVVNSGAKGERMVSYLPPQGGGMFSRGRRLLSSVRGRDRKHRKKFKKMKKFENTERRSESGVFLDGAVEYGRDWGENDHTLFAVVRDPAERFISAIGQATGGKGSKKNGVAKQLISECLKDTRRETLRCFVDLIKRRGTWIEIHFTPMVFELSFGSMYKDVPIAIFPFTEMPTLLYELNADPALICKNGNKDGYRVSEVLSNMTVEHYDYETLCDLCEIYEMDVAFLQHINHSTSCDSCFTKIL